MYNQMILIKKQLAVCSCFLDNENKHPPAGDKNAMMNISK